MCYMYYFINDYNILNTILKCGIFGYKNWNFKKILKYGILGTFLKMWNLRYKKF